MATKLDHTMFEVGNCTFTNINSAAIGSYLHQVNYDFIPPQLTHAPPHTHTHTHTEFHMVNTWPSLTMEFLSHKTARAC